MRTSSDRCSSPMTTSAPRVMHSSSGLRAAVSASRRSSNRLVRVELHVEPVVAPDCVAVELVDVDLGRIRDHLLRDGGVENAVVLLMQKIAGDCVLRLEDVAHLDDH